MRTTVTLDPDVEVQLREAMRARGIPFKQALNDALRRGLRPQRAGAVAPFKQLTFDSGRPLVDLTKANALAGELEDQDQIAKLGAGR